MSVVNIVKKQLKRHEGFRHKPYRCPAGKLSIGYGRNIEDNGISEQEAGMLLEHDIEDAITDARLLFPNFDRLDMARQSVLVNMAYNLGRHKLAGFHNLRKAVLKNNFVEAAKQMRDSHWAQQVKDRATELATMMECGTVDIKIETLA